MRLLRALAIVALLAVCVYAGYRFFASPKAAAPGASIVVYYCKSDGQTLVPWTVSLGPARDRNSVAFYAATQAVAGPPSDVDAVRFPSGTIVRHAAVSSRTATVDLAGPVSRPADGSFAESGEFKALVWTLTALPDVAAVQVTIDGARVSTLPGGHLELDEPLARSSF